MLVELRCDKFQEKGRPRPAIKFHPGLNVVLGDEMATNSIGKSTFLLIIDFIFGGNDYVEKTIDDIRHVGDHTFYFSFIFNGENFYFSRGTSNHQTVMRMTKEYTPSEEWTLEQYQRFLLAQYNLNNLDLTFRQIVSRFIRVYHRNSLDEHNPLHADSKEKGSKIIENLLKLFSCYDDVKDAITLLNECEEKSKAFKNGVKHGFIEIIKTKTEYKKQQKEIEKKKTQKEHFIPNVDLGERTAEEFDAISRLRYELQVARAKRTRLQNKIDRLKEEKPRVMFENDLNSLAELFPGIAIKKLEEIELFHFKMVDILSEEIKNETNRTQQELTEIIERIKALEVDLAGSNDINFISRKSLDEYSKLDNEISTITKQLDCYEKNEGRKKELKTLRKNVIALTQEKRDYIENKLNNTMKEIDARIYANKKPPCINLSPKGYTFRTIDDNGTGSAWKSLIVLDLTFLHLTSVPLLVHDSLIFKNIGNQPLDKIIQLYRKEQKQVFIALDKISSYDKETQDARSTCSVLTLSKDDESLFGKSWSMKVKGNTTS